ncbi:MAG: NF038129 family PEP-CTERM protein [Candidatus Solibacter sp.]|nr:NF038129 family PEP-CTERM protein [Candidatus Solibacter sp.]
MRTLFVLSAFMCFVSVASADFMYQVTVDTSTISGTAGSFDLQFNPGPLVSQSAFLQILSFASDGTLAGLPQLTGDVNGALPTTLTFDNGTGFNDYFEEFAFGSTLSLTVSLYGPALSLPDGTSTSGSVFAFSMFSDAAGTIPALTTDGTNGFALTVDLNLDATTAITNFSAQTSVVPAAAAVPEPSSFVLLGTALAGWGMRRWRQRVARY